MRSHEERSDEPTFEKTTRPVLDEIPEARLRVRLGFKQTHNRTSPARKRGGREGSVQNARPVLKPARSSCCTQKKHIHVLPGCAFTNQRGHVTRTAIAASSENTNVKHDLSRLITNTQNGPTSLLVRKNVLRAKHLMCSSKQEVGDYM